RYWRQLLFDREAFWRKKLRRRLRTTLALERQINFLRALASRITRASRPEEVSEAVVEMLSSTLRLDTVLIYALDGQEGAPRLIASRGLSAEEAKQWQQVKVEEGAVVPAAVAHASPTLQLAVPLVAGARPLGLLAVGTWTARELSAEELGLLESAADYLAMAMENPRLYQNLRHYVQQITVAQENERRRIARELHDSTLQSLIAILHHLESFLRERRDLPMSDSRFLWRLGEQIKDTIQEVRYFSHHLRPAILDDLGLLPAVEWLLGEMRREYGLAARLLVSGEPCRFLPEAEVNLFRIIQEALRNVVRHAKATRVEVSLCFHGREAVVSVRDNGIGFQVPSLIGDLTYKGKLGLAGMEERVHLLQGKLFLESQPGRGTTVKVLVPLAGNIEPLRRP
ncbi:MAG: GAF domain-containing sensor histidine kinase, partial [Clostridia bacterium]|nr:GAF domain-containing sensor histidine kinase [Clostridia bacterium]